MPSRLTRQMTLDDEGKPVWDDDIDITDIVGAVRARHTRFR